MTILDNKRHELFALGIFKGMSQHDAAIQAGYMEKWIDSTASTLARNPKIFDRIIELFQGAETEGTMSVIERKERLSEIARGRLSDFIETKEDGTIVKVNIAGGHSAALSEVTVTEFTGGKDQRAKSQATKVKLHDPVRPIDLLNRMDAAYPVANVLKIEAGEGLQPVITELLSRLRGYSGNKDKDDNKS